MRFSRTNSVQLSELRSLRIEYVLWERASSVFRELYAPRLTSLYIEGEDWPASKRSRSGWWMQELTRYCTNLAKFLTHHDAIERIAIQGPSEIFQAVLTPQFMGEGGTTTAITSQLTLPRLRTLAIFDDGEDVEAKSRVVKSFLDSRTNVLDCLALSRSLYEDEEWAQARAGRFQPLGPERKDRFWDYD